MSDKSLFIFIEHILESIKDIDTFILKTLYLNYREFVLREESGTSTHLIPSIGVFTSRLLWQRK